MQTIQKLALNAAVAVMLSVMGGCTAIGIGVGAVAGSGSSVGMLGGAVIGGVIGYEIGK